MNASTLLLCLILLVVVVIAVFSMKKRATSGCCGGNETVKKIKVKDKDKSHYPYQIKLKVFDIHCQNCVRTIENAFAQLDGFYASVDTTTNEVTVLMKQEHPSSEIIAIIADAGYVAKEIEK